MRRSDVMTHLLIHLCLFLFSISVMMDVNAVSEVKERSMNSDDLIHGPVKLTVVYDNYPCENDLTTAWGFSCLIEGVEKAILFDTGGDGDVLLSNAKQLGLDPSKVDCIVISHNHWDHKGGIASVLGLAPGIPVYVPATALSELQDGIASAGGKAIPVSESIEICKGVFSTGEIRGPVNEQALVLETEKGLIAITGCSHPGIDKILNVVKSKFDTPIHLVFGGFHLMRYSETDLSHLLDDLSRLSVEHWGPTHCTGDFAIQRFRERFGDRMMTIGAGRVIEINAEAEGESP